MFLPSERHGGLKWDYPIRPSQNNVLLVRKDLLYPSDLAVFELHFDPAGMEGGGCEDYSNLKVQSEPEKMADN